MTNHLHETSPLRVMLEVDADFADLFEVKDGAIAAREVTFTHDGASLTLAYRHGAFRRSVTVASSSPAAVTRAGFAYDLELGHGEQWSTTFTITPRAAQSGIRFARARATGRARRRCAHARAAELEAWLARAPPYRPTTRRWCARTARASATSARCGCAPTSLRARRCPRPACRGSWRSSVATA